MIFSKMLTSASVFVRANCIHFLRYFEEFNAFSFVEFFYWIVLVWDVLQKWQASNVSKQIWWLPAVCHYTYNDWLSASWFTHTWSCQHCYAYWPKGGNAFRWEITAVLMVSNGPVLFDWSDPIWPVFLPAAGEKERPDRVRPGPTSEKERAHGNLVWIQRFWTQMCIQQKLMKANRVILI